MNAPTDSHPIRTGVISTVVGAILLAGLAQLWSTVKVACAWLWMQAKWFVGLFAADYSTPGWILAVLGIVTLVTFIRLMARLARSSAASAPAHIEYTTDFFHGAKWRWGWSGQNISHLWCFCPSCDSELVYDDSSCNDILQREAPRTDFICEHCNHTTIATVAGGRKNYALSAIEREIRRKLRTGEAA